MLFTCAGVVIRGLSVSKWLLAAGRPSLLKEVMGLSPPSLLKRRRRRRNTGLCLSLSLQLQWGQGGVWFLPHTHTCLHTRTCPQADTRHSGKGADSHRESWGHGDCLRSAQTVFPKIGRQGPREREGSVGQRPHQGTVPVRVEQGRGRPPGLERQVPQK